MDNIVFERIWDSSFNKMRITAQSKQVKVTTDEMYFNDSDILILSNLLASLPFPLQNNTEYKWIPDARSRMNCDIGTELSFEITQKDKQGHIWIEVYILIDDGNIQNKHHCCFFVETEIGLLNTFGKRLSNFNKLANGEKISLIDFE